MLTMAPILLNGTSRFVIQANIFQYTLAQFYFMKGKNKWYKLTSSCRNRDVMHPQFEVEHIGAHKRSRNRLNGGQGQNKIGSAHLHHVGIAIHA